MTSLGAQVIYYQFYGIHFNLLDIVANGQHSSITSLQILKRILLYTEFSPWTSHSSRHFIHLLIQSFISNKLSGSTGASALGDAGLAMPDTGAYV